MRLLNSGLTLAAGSITAFALVLTSPPMVSTADGCSGGPSYQVDDPDGRWDSLEYVDGHTVPMDGLLVLQGKRRSLAANNHGLVAVTVNVTDALAQPVSGKTWLEAGEGDWPVTSHVVWQPAAPLQVGAVYTLDWHVKQKYTVVDGSATMLTSGGVSLLAHLETTTPVLQRTNALTGVRVECHDSWHCNVPPFGTSEIQPYGMRFSVLPPNAPDTFQALSVREVPGKGTFAQTYDTPPPARRGVMAAPWLEQVEFSMWFAEELPEYCVEFVQRDLRNGVERKKEVCVTRAEKAPEGGVFLDDRLDRCASPPNSALTERWCRLHPDGKECAALGSPGDAGLDGDAAPHAARPNDTGGCGCGVASRTSGRGQLLVALLLILAWNTRNRSRLARRRHTPWSGARRA